LGHLSIFLQTFFYLIVFSKYIPINATINYFDIYALTNRIINNIIQFQQ